MRSDRSPRCGSSESLRSSARSESSALRPRRASDRTGLDLFGGARVGLPAAQDSFEAVALELGLRVRRRGPSNRDLAETVPAGAAKRWSDSGERAFVDSDGNTFPLGIPLELKATYVDATVGVKSAVLYVFRSCVVS